VRGESRQLGVGPPTRGWTPTRGHQPEVGPQLGVDPQLEDNNWGLVPSYDLDVPQSAAKPCIN